MNQADTAWMLISTALVLLMTPALAFFYGGLVRSKNALNTMMMSFISLGFVGVLWALVGLLAGLRARQRLDRRPVARASCAASASRRRARSRTCSSCAYQGTFAIITAALISGAIVERMRFSAYVALHLRSGRSLVYSPVAHWVWGGGWLADDGRARLRRRHRRARQRRRRRARGRHRASASARTIASSGAPAAQRAVHAARRRPALVRLVRLQRRQRARARARIAGARVHDDDARAGGRRWSSGRCST